MKVTVWPHPFVRGWTGDPERDAAPDAKGNVVGRFEVLDLGDALRRDWPTDAHFVPYRVRFSSGDEPEAVPRLNLSGFAALAKGGHEVIFDGVVFDVDCPAAHRGDAPEAPADWRERERAKLAELPAELSDIATYDTRGGYRVIYELPEPVGPEAYQRAWKGLAGRLRAHGIAVDELRDVTRCYRLPRVVREGRPSRFVAELDDLAPIEPDVLARVLPADGAEEASPFRGIESKSAPLDLERQITENRNVTLTRLGGLLRRAGLEADEILDTLRSVAAKRAPDWSPDPGELEHIAESCARYEAAPLPAAVAPTGPMSDDDVRFLLGSEAELARAVLADLEVEDTELVFDRTRLFGYAPDRGVWVEVEDSEIQGHVAGWDGEYIGTGGYNADGTPKVRPLKVSAGLTRGVLDLVRVFRSSRGFFDGAEEGITFSNGFVGVSEAGDVAVHPFRSSQRSTAALPHAYQPGRVPRRFVAMLRECWRDEPDVDARIQLLREFIGACLLGAATRYQRGVIFLGDGANGKSTVQEIVAALFPGDLVTAIPPQEMAQEYRRAMLADSRLNLVNELPEADILVSEAVKAILSGDKILGRFIREQPFSFYPRCGNLFAANELPGVRDMSRGFWRRWIVLEFRREFTPEEQDPRLAERIIATELAELASWAVEGAAALAARGTYDVPASSEEALAEWRESSDIVARFLAERTTATAEPRTKAADLYGAFSSWCLTSEHRTGPLLSKIKFGKRLKRLGVVRERRADGYYYARNVRLGLVKNEELKNEELKNEELKN